MEDVLFTVVYRLVRPAVAQALKGRTRHTILQLFERCLLLLTFLGWQIEARLLLLLLEELHHVEVLIE